MQNLILECSIRAFLIAICMGAVLFVLRVKAERARHAVWAGAVVFMLALPVWTAWGPKAAVRVLKPAAAPAIISTVAVFSQPLPQAPGRNAVWTWQKCAAAIYLLGFLSLLARLAIGTVRAYILVRGATKQEGRLTSHSCAAPVTVGWLNPAVILPEHWRQWPQAQLHAVLTHEGEHARWRDPLVQWLALFNRAIFWFHPLAWWLERRLSALSEEACDAAVLAQGHDRFEYSEYLLEIARAMQQTGARVNVMGMAMPGPFLPQRIRRILEGRPAQRISRVRMVCVAVACAAVSTVFTAGAMDQAQAVANPDPPPHQKPIMLLAQAQTSPKPGPAPQEGGSISGTVQDPSGARVPNCLVVLRSQSGASEMTTRSDAAGVYRFASIPPGHYNIQYQMPGFAIVKMQTAIEAAKPSRLDAKLSLGQTSETLTVTAKRPAAAPAPSAAPPSEPGPILVGGRVEAARLIKHADPIYPPELKQQGIEGTVQLAAVISADGVPAELRVLNAGEVDSRLVQAALDAVSQWRYQPAKLNEHPVANATKIDVTFELSK